MLDNSFQYMPYRARRLERYSIAGLVICLWLCTEIMGWRKVLFVLGFVLVFCVGGAVLMAVNELRGRRRMKKRLAAVVRAK